MSDEQTTANIEQRSKTTEGQRAINLLWENTQSRIALFVVIAGIFTNSIVIVLLIIMIRQISVVQVALVSMCLQFINLTTGIVIGFYFSRTNHAAIGGVGAKPVQEYDGR